MAAAVSAGQQPYATADPVWLVPAPDGSLDRHFVDLQRDATAADIRRAVDAGMRAPEHVKRFTTIGTGNDQGRTSGINEVGILAEFLGVTPGGPRPDQLPAAARSRCRCASSAARYRGDLFDPIRTTPIHESHVAAGALFENVGQWKRAWAYPRTRTGSPSTRPCSASAGRSAKASGSWTSRRSARSTSRARTRRLPRPRSTRTCSRRSRSDSRGTA